MKRILATPSYYVIWIIQWNQHDGHMAGRFDYGGEVGWERPSIQAVETRAVQVSLAYPD
jgi:hypothetical protein